MDKKRPIRKFRAGNVQVAVWANKGIKGTWLSVTVSRSYRNERGDWQDSNGFGLQDLPLLCKLLDLAFDSMSNPQGQPDAGDPAHEAMNGYGSPPESWNEVSNEPT